MPSLVSLSAPSNGPFWRYLKAHVSALSVILAWVAHTYAGTSWWQTYGALIVLVAGVFGVALAPNADPAGSVHEPDDAGAPAQAPITLDKPAGDAPAAHPMSIDPAPAPAVAPVAPTT